MGKTLSVRMKFIIAFNILISFYYFRFFIKSLARDWDFQTPLYFLSSLGLLISALFLLQKKSIGKTLTKFVGALGIITIIGILIWALNFFNDPRYTFEANMENLIVNTLIYSIRHAYPIIAGFIILNKPDEELGLQ